MLKIISQKRILFLFFSLSVFILSFSQASAAGLIPCGLGANDPCTLCHFLVGIKGLIDWGMKILITISITGITIAGVMYVVSSGDPTFAQKAKGFISSVVIGFSLMLGAWLIINTLFYVFSAKKGADGAYSLGLESKNWYSFSCSTTSTSVGGLTPTTETPIAGYDCSKLTFQSGISAQCNDASPALQTMIVCMQNLLGSKMTINSISDSAGLSKCTTSYAKPPCAHEKSSCHYGGVTGGKSEAVDISTTTGLTVGNITTAANSCDAGFTQDESRDKNHVHVSTQTCKNN